MAEGIPVDLVEFSDNRPVLDMLLSRPLGLLGLLDEESRFPKSSDLTLTREKLSCEKLSIQSHNFVSDKFHNNIKSKFYQRPKSDAMCFSIQHFGEILQPFENIDFVIFQICKLFKLEELSIILTDFWRRTKIFCPLKLFN